MPWTIWRMSAASLGGMRSNSIGASRGSPRRRSKCGEGSSNGNIHPVASRGRQYNPHNPLKMSAHSDSPTRPIVWADVLRAECRALNPLFGGASGDALTSHSGDSDIRLEALNRAVLAEGHSALCLSGGGIRSASFAVGVMQGLAR